MTPSFQILSTNILGLIIQAQSGYNDWVDNTSRSNWLSYLVLALLLYIFYKVNRKVSLSAMGDILGRWSKLFEFQFSPEEFYKAVEEEVRKMGIEDIEFKRISFPQGNFFSANREYLRVYLGRLTFDVCASPYGTGFFVSYWHGETRSFIRELLTSIPFVGAYIERIRSKKTYYELDLISMYNTTVISAIQKAVDDMTNKKGYRILNHEEKQPVSTIPKVD